jgi:hypothetical protein
MKIEITLSTGKKIELTQDELVELLGNKDKISLVPYPTYPTYPTYPWVTYKTTCGFNTGGAI